MAIEWRHHSFHFETPDDWSLDDDLNITADVLATDDPTDECVWGKRWSYFPLQLSDYDVNGDFIWPVDVQMKALRANFSRYDEDDAELVFWLMRTDAPTAADDVTFRIRWDDLADEYVSSVIETLFAGQLVHSILASDGGLVYRTTSGVNDIFPVDTWRKVVFRSVGTAHFLKVYDQDGQLYAALGHSGLFDRTDPGTFGVYQPAAASRVWTAGLTTKPMPLIAVPKSGTAELQTDATCIFTAPANIDSLGKLLVAYEFTNDVLGAHIAEVELEYRIDTGMTPGAWTAVPEGGDMSGVSMNAYQTLLARVTLTNASEYHTWPGVASIDLSYAVTVPSSEMEDHVKALLSNIKTLLEADPTVSGYDNFGGAWVAIWGLALPMESRCAVLMRPDITIESDYEENAYHELAELKSYDHWIDLYPTFRRDLPSAHELMMDDDGLMDFTEAVKTALREENFSGAVKVMEVKEAEWGVNAVDLNVPSDWVVANRVRIRVRSPLFEG